MADVIQFPTRRADIQALVEQIKALVYAESGRMSVAEAIGVLEVTKLEILAAMRQHLTAYGFAHWPEHFNVAQGHITKAEQQEWLRHLFALEARAQPAQAVRAKMGVAVPLTDEQINDAYGEARVQHDHIPHDDVARIARSVEKHHGIVGKEGA